MAVEILEQECCTAGHNPLRGEKKIGYQTNHTCNRLHYITPSELWFILAGNELIFLETP